MPHWEDAGISRDRCPPESQTTSLLLFGLCNIAIFDLIRSRQKSLNNSGPVPHFSKIMTSKIRGVGEMRYNRARSRPRCTRILTGGFTVKIAPDDNNIQPDLK